MGGGAAGNYSVQGGGRFTLPLPLQGGSFTLPPPLLPLRPLPRLHLLPLLPLPPPHLPPLPLDHPHPLPGPLPPLPLLLRPLLPHRHRRDRRWRSFASLGQIQSPLPVSFGPSALRRWPPRC